MKTPTAPKQTLKVTDKFVGVDRRLPDDARFEVLDNLNVVANAALQTVETPVALREIADGGILPFCADKIGWFAPDGTLWYAGEQVDGWNLYDTTAARHSAAVLGRTVVLFPEKAWFCVDDLSFGTIEFSRTALNTRLSAAFSDGVEPSEYYYGNVSDSPADNAMWMRRIDLDNNFKLFRYYADPEEWVEQDAVRYTLRGFNDGEGISAGTVLYIDGISVRGFAFTDFDGTYVVRGVEANSITFEGAPSFTAMARITSLNSSDILLDTVTLSRRAPDLAFVCRAGSRVWGADVDGRTIYACAEGDPVTWERSLGDSLDSYYTTVGSAGAFLGGGSMDGVPVLFKNACAFRIIGSRPDNFTAVETSLDGIAPDAAATSCVDYGGAVYYCGSRGIYRWDGDTPQLVSAPLGRIGTFRSLAVYDGELWAACDGVIHIYRLRGGGWRSLTLDAQTLVPFSGAMYMTSDGRVLRVGENDGETLGTPTPVEALGWRAASGSFPPNGDCGCISRGLCLDIESKNGATVDVFFAWDGVSSRVTSLVFKGRLRREFPLPQRFLDTCAYELAGTGDVIIRSVAVRASMR